MSRATMIALAAAVALGLSACGDGGGNQASQQADGGSEDGSMEGQDAMQGDESGQQGDSMQGGESSMEGESGGSQSGDSAMAVAKLSATKEFDTSGEVRFSQTDSGVRLEGTLKNLEPGKHGFHIHAKGDCSAPDGKSAGGHFNPTDAKHGAPQDSEHHVGDLGNIDADESGLAKIGGTYEFLSLSGDNSIMGKAVIVHAGKDDLKSEPSGDAGARVACGVIEKAGGGSG